MEESQYIEVKELFFWAFGVGVTVLIFMVKYLLGEIRDLNNRLTEYQLEITKNYITAEQLKSLESRLNKQVCKN